MYKKSMFTKTKQNVQRKHLITLKRDVNLDPGSSINDVTHLFVPSPLILPKKIGEVIFERSLSRRWQ
jgi:hypothetical protein